MENTEKILALFPSEDIKDKLKDIISAIQYISNKEPIVGFHHSFYVPGWIGVIQLMIVESNMNKFTSETFYKEMNYLQFAQWIADQSEEIAELQKGIDIDDYLLKESQNNAIIDLFLAISTLWMNYLPEASRHPSIKYTEDSLISPAGLLFKLLEESLKDLGYSPSKDKESSKTSFKEEIKNQFNFIVGYILNILLLGCIFAIIGAIFD